MPLDTLATLVGKVQQRVGLLPDYFLVVDWITAATREVFRDNDWTWRRRRGQFLFYAPVNAGTVTVIRGNNYGDFLGITPDQTWVGRQFRVGTDTPILTIKRVSGQRVWFDAPWGAAGVAGVGYEVYSCWLAVPGDFDHFNAIVDLQRNYQIDWWSYTNSDLDRIDSRRAVTGNQAVVITLRDYTDDAAGVVGLVIQARGTGNAPVSGGAYDGVADATFTVEMTDATHFRWKKDGGAYVSGVPIDSGGNDQQLSDGVSIAFPNTVVYTSGDVFIVPCSAQYAAGVPRYEPWPHIKADEVRPYLYVARPPDLIDPGAVLPRYVPGDLIVEKALGACARWKHPDNRYFDLKLSAIHEARASDLLASVEREDSARSSDDLVYDTWTNLPVLDANYLASRDMGFEINTL